jgi:hypothetical protein
VKLLATYCILRPPQVEASRPPIAGRAPSDDHRRGTAGLWHPACRRAYEALAAPPRVSTGWGCLRNVMSRSLRT